MAIRETWNRMVRKSFSSSSSGARSDDGQDTPTAGTAGTSPMPSTPAPLSKSSSRLGGLSKMASWRSHNSHNHSGGSDGSNNGGKEGGDSSSRKASPKRNSPPKSILKRSGGGGGGFGSGFPRRVHPSERPLTEQNLRHQEMLGTFTMKFGRSRRFSRGARSSFSGISPRCSVDSTAAGGGAAGWGDVDDEDHPAGGPGYHGRMSSAAVAPDEARIAEESS
ncbi:hypothetical protein Daus18300_002422 [Diaporthe australafricana]|uniref:Uncharacterized protein n=1 Tax=Diaporthe australafricana TaxID=127596 RepID=A0ABR3XNZ2_9PEZI